MLWLELRAEVDGVLVEAAASALLERGAGGVAVEEGSRTVISAYFPDTPDGRLSFNEARQAMEGLPAFFDLAARVRVCCRKRSAGEWEDAWKKYYKALRLGPFLIVPAWEEPRPREGANVLRLDPGLAFGTGQHPTTQMVLEAMAPEVRRGARLIDLGTGSGILAIGAALLGADPVWGVDRDPQAVRSARANVRLNGLTGRVRLIRGEINDWLCRGHSPVDVVLANITAGVIQSVASQVAMALGGKGVFIASGIIERCEEDTARAIEGVGFAVEGFARRSGWSCLVARG